MINKLPPFKGLNIKIPNIIPIKGRGFTNQESIFFSKVWALLGDKSINCSIAAPKYFGAPKWEPNFGNYPFGSSAAKRLIKVLAFRIGVFCFVSVRFRQVQGLGLAA